MRTDHAFVINDQKVDLPSQIIDYMAQKANRLGLDGRKIINVYVESEQDGRHVYYETVNLWGDRDLNSK